MTFVEKYLSGNAKIEDIDDYIDQWHEGNSKKSIYKFLGMKKEEYKLWISGIKNLKDILSQRRN